MSEPVNFNPYAPPVTQELGADYAAAIRREGNLLIVPAHAAGNFPAKYCIKCGESAIGTAQQRYAVRGGSSMKLKCGLCAMHRLPRLLFALIAYLFFGLAALCLALYFGVRLMGRAPENWWGVAAAFLLMGFAIMGWFGLNYMLVAIRITKTEGVFKGAGEGFLARLNSLPPTPKP